MALAQKRITLQDQCVRELSERFGENISTADTVLEQHGRDEGYLPSIPPDAVIFVQSNEEILEIIRICKSHRKPVIPF